MTAPGWIALWRKIRENWTWKIKPFSPGQALVDLFLRANWTDTKIPNPGKIGPTTLRPGEAIISLRGLQADWGWSRGRVIRFLKALENDTTIETTNETTFTRCKVLNWKGYQDFPELDGTTHGTTGETTPRTTPGTHHNNTNHLKKGKKGTASSSGGQGGEDGEISGETYRLMGVARRVTKMPNKDEALIRYIDAAIARFGVDRVERWLRQEKNRGANVLKMEDGLSELGPAPRPKQPACTNCGGRGLVETRGGWSQCEACTGKPKTGGNQASG